jgi:hypothetical protein
MAYRADLTDDGSIGPGSPQPTTGAAVSTGPQSYHGAQ